MPAGCGQCLNAVPIRRLQQASPPGKASLHPIPLSTSPLERRGTRAYLLWIRISTPCPLGQGCDLCTCRLDPKRSHHCSSPVNIESSLRGDRPRLPRAFWDAEALTCARRAGALGSNESFVELSRPSREMQGLNDQSRWRFARCLSRGGDLHVGTWCSGITSALHAEGPGFNPQCVQFVCSRLVPLYTLTCRRASDSLQDRARRAARSACRLRGFAVGCVAH